MMCATMAQDSEFVLQNGCKKQGVTNMLALPIKYEFCTSTYLTCSHSNKVKLPKVGLNAIVPEPRGG